MDLTSLVIVTHNQLDFTRLCVESIERHTSEPYELSGRVAGAFD